MRIYETLRYTGSGLFLVCIFWFLSVTAGMAALTRYALTPGVLASVAPTAPDSDPANGRLRLILFAHPLCPCTRATLTELGRLLTLVADSRPQVEIVFVAEGEDVSEDGKKSLNRQLARALPGVLVREDAGGEEARRYGAQTSGQVFLFAADGSPLFNGGITAARGHEGDNSGAASLRRILGHPTNGSAGPVRFPVFGCPLL